MRTRGKARNSKLDMMELGQKMAARKQELLAEPQLIPKKPAAVSELPSQVPA